ncbi:MAG TPA: glycosyltransferase family 39 protein [Anaerolineae bacterium]|nr:glycosyltransferase family 39 protein [Anaerolineae bacterium]
MAGRGLARDRRLLFDLSVLFLLTLSVRVLLALPQQQPHYFDAYYYYNVAENLHLGRGFTVDFIWNYLDAPSAVTHPSNLYWTPLSSILAWFSMGLFGTSYRAAQIPFVLLSSLPPLLAYAISWQIYSRRDYAWLAATLTAFAPFYLKYWACPDNFAPFAVSAGLCLVTMHLLWSRRRARYALFTGALIGVSHLARADGVLLWVSFGVFLIVILLGERRGKQEPYLAGQSLTVAGAALWIALALAGYFVIMLPWFWRNWTVIGAPLSSAGTKTVFLRSYADLFSYSADLTWRSYLGWGWGEILRSKASAALHNLAVVLGALQFHLAPLALVGLWQLRRQRAYLPFHVYAATLYLSMTLIFTFPSTHASMLHSTAALLPFLFAATLPGIDAVVGWVARRRRTWHAPTAKVVFRFGLTAVVVAISLFDYSRSVFLSLDPVGVRPLWNQANTGYQAVSLWLDEHAADDAVVMVVDPPAYYYFTHRPAIVIPNEEIDGILEVASRYAAEYLILEYDHVPSLDPFYHGEAAHPALALEHTFQDASANEIQIYKIRR